MAEMASRISSLEHTLTKARDEVAAARSPLRNVNKETPSTQPRTASPDDTVGELAAADVLVHNGSSSQYFNEVIFSKFIEGVRVFLSINF
jgi:hypothetical protein